MKKKVELLEIRRQSAHLFFGFIIASLLHIGLVDRFFLLGALLIFFALSLFSIRFRVPVFAGFLKIFERDKDLKIFPGKGALMYLLGATITAFLFPRDIAVASILILAFGDSVSHIFGRHFGRIKTSWHDKKHIEGSAFGILISGFVASFFVPLLPAFLASLVAMIIEFPQINIRGHKIDDNITVPLAAGLTLYLLL